MRSLVCRMCCSTALQACPLRRCRAELGFPMHTLHTHRLAQQLQRRRRAEPRFHTSYVDWSHAGRGAALCRSVRTW
jgi:hypothetical protein